MTEIAFTGDIAFSKYFTGRSGDKNLLAPEILSFLKSADHVIPNVEGPISDGEKKGTDAATPVHASDAYAADWLMSFGGDIWNVSNNHVLDCSLSGFDDTVRAAERVGARVFGAGRNVDEARAPVILPEEGGIGIFSICYRRLYKATAEKEGTLHWLDDENIQKTIDEIKKTCRYCILIAHCGEEFSPLPPTYIHDRYHAFLQMGADVVVGHHPHVPQHYEKVGNKFIFYSLGNFIFDTDYQRIQAHTDLGVLIKLRFDGEALSFTHLPYRIDRKTHTLQALDDLFIFRNIPSRVFRRVTPLSTHVFWQNYRRARLFLRPYQRTMTKAQFIESYRKERTPAIIRSVRRERRRYHAVPWRKEDPALISYILEKPKKQ